MAMLNKEMKNMLAVQLPIVATVTEGIDPNIGPKRSLRTFGDDALIYNENTAGQHLANIENGSKVAVAIIDRENLAGYRFIGRASVHYAGAAWENCLEFAANNGMKTPHAAVVIAIEDVFTLHSGPKAGKKVVADNTGAEKAEGQ